MSTIQDNKAIARSFIESMSRHDIDGVLAAVHDDLVNHAALPEAQGAAGLRIILGKLFEAFPDAEYRCQDVIAEGDRVVCRVRMRGTQAGPMRFLAAPLEASGKEVDTEMIHVFRIADGKVVEHWGGRDDLGMLRQLGHLRIAGGVS